MSNTLLDLTTPTLPDGFCWPSTPQALANALFALSKAVWPGTITGIHIGLTPPTDLTLLWVKTDANGSPIGTFTHSGVGPSGWTMPHPDAPAAGFRKLWIGLAANVPALDGGNANAVADADGPFWVIDANFAFRSPIGPGTNPQGGFDGNPATVIPEPSDVDASHGVGGTEQIQLGIGNIPSHQHYVRSRDAEPGDNGGDPLQKEFVQDWDSTAGSNSGPVYTSFAGGDAGRGLATDYFSVMNPWKAVYFLKRTARLYIVG